MKKIFQFALLALLSIAPCYATQVDVHTTSTPFHIFYHIIILKLSQNEIHINPSCNI